jgi:hypothetical protein
MFALSREEALSALHALEVESLQHYDARCPRCKKANRVAKDRLEKAYPNWQEEYEAMMKEAAEMEAKQKSLEAAEDSARKKKAPKKAKRKPRKKH